MSSIFPRIQLCIAQNSRLVPDSYLASVLVLHLLGLFWQHPRMLFWDIPLAYHVVELLHGTFPRVMHITAGTTNEKTIVRGVSLTPILLTSEPLPATEIPMLGRSAMGARLRWHSTILLVPTSIWIDRSHIRRSVAGWCTPISSGSHMDRSQSIFRIQFVGVLF